MKLYMFQKVPLSIIRSFSLYTQQWYMSYRFADSLQAGSGWNSFHPDPELKQEMRERAVQKVLIMLQLVSPCIACNWSRIAKQLS